MVMTHLTEVADRIDRSNSPWGGREERELFNYSKTRAAQHSPGEIVLCWLTNQDGVLLQPGHLSLVHAYDAIFRAK